MRAARFPACEDIDEKDGNTEHMCSGFQAITQFISGINGLSL